MIRHRGVLTGSSYAVDVLPRRRHRRHRRRLGEHRASRPYQTGLLDLRRRTSGSSCSVLASGALADSTDKARLMSAGSLLLAVSFFFYYLWPAYALNLADHALHRRGHRHLRGRGGCHAPGHPRQAPGTAHQRQPLLRHLRSPGHHAVPDLPADGLAAVHGAVRGRGARPGRRSSSSPGRAGERRIGAAAAAHEVPEDPGRARRLPRCWPSSASASSWA